MDKTNVYCRFCAAQKSANAIIDLTCSAEMLETVKNWLSSLKINFVDFSIKALPTSICWDCYENLYKYRNFVNKIKVSQADLTRLLSNEIEESCENEQFSQPCKVKLEMECVKKNEVNDNMENSIPEAITWATYPYICLQCKTSCDTILDLREHSKAFHGTTEGFKCADCDIVVLGLTGLIDHVRDHRPELREYCPICNDKVEDDNHMSIHSEIFLDHPTSNIKPEIQAEALEEQDGLSNSWETYPWACQICSTLFPTQEKLRNHLKDDHSKCFGFKCADCTTELGSFVQFVEHAKMHRPSLKGTCEYCCFKITGETEYVLHIKEHALDNQCEVCGEIFCSKALLDTHTLKFGSNPKTVHFKPLEFVCNICGKVCLRTTSLIQHKKIHMDNGGLTCVQCDMEFFNKKDLNEHNLIHHVFPRDCKICKKTFSTMKGLNKHEKLHNPERPFHCQECPKTFQRKTNLKRHMIVHTNKSFPCHYCEKIFKFKDALKRHEHQHTGTKPCCCTICDMKFNNWYYLNKHTRQMHVNTLANSVLTPPENKP